MSKVVINYGDKMTIAGKYKRRTLWEWLTRRARELQIYKVTNVISGDAEQGDF